MNVLRHMTTVSRHNVFKQSEESGMFAVMQFRQHVEMTDTWAPATPADCFAAPPQYGTCLDMSDMVPDCSVRLLITDLALRSVTNSFVSKSGKSLTWAVSKRLALIIRAIPVTPGVGAFRIIDIYGAPLPTPLTVRFDLDRDDKFVFVTP